MEDIDIGLLSTLDALLQEGSVTRAARRLGLSTPAMSHALARIRDKLADPILVRAGRSMVLTPRAEEIRPRVQSLVAEARVILAARRPFSPQSLDRHFVIRATDHVLALLGPVLDRIASAEAPGISLRFLPNSPDDAGALRDGDVDLAVGIYGDLPPEVRTRQLLTDRLVCVVREGHPRVGEHLSLEQLLATPHIQVAPRGKPGGYVDDVLAARGLTRRVARAVPYFLAALLLVSETDNLLIISERVARAFATRFGLKLLEPPIELRPYALSLLWHPRMDGDPAHGWLRDLFLRSAREAAGDQHAHARTRLEKGGPLALGRGSKKKTAKVSA